MKELMNMDIAGVRFTLSGDSSIELHRPDNAYIPFVIDGKCGKEDFSVDVRLETGTEIPGTEDLVKIFDSGQSWSLFQDGDGYSIVLAPPDCDRPLWLARSNNEFNRVTIFCSDQLFINENSRNCISNPLLYPLDQIILMHFLGRRQGLLVHAMGLVKEGKGYIFPGKSGAGKSTLAMQLHKDDNLEFLSDDRVVIRRIGNDYIVFGTPWPGDAGNVLNKGCPLEGIFFIEHGSSNRKIEITTEGALERFFSVSSIPWYDRELVPEMLQFCEELVSNVPAYELQCRKDIRVEDVFN